MRVVSTFESLSEADFTQGTAIAIGKFDAVHLGHQALLARITAVGRERGLEPVVFTFNSHPRNYLRPGEAPPAVMGREQRLEAIAAAGVETCVMLPFDERIANIPASAYIERVLVGQMRAKYLCVGDDFRFGRGGQGNVALLEQQAASLGFEVEVVAEVDDDLLGRVSSSNIREAISRGEVETAGRMMGRAPAVRGMVVHGDARGRELGFPTANLGPTGSDGTIEGLVPADGVYAGWAVVRGQRFQAAISVGVNLTFEPGGQPRVEAHLLDYAGDLYGEPIEVRFVKRLRGMVAFESVDALIHRMRQDVTDTQELLLNS